MKKLQNLYILCAICLLIGFSRFKNWFFLLLHLYLLKQHIVVSTISITLKCKAFFSFVNVYLLMYIQNISTIKTLNIFEIWHKFYKYLWFKCFSIKTKILFNKKRRRRRLQWGPFYFSTTTAVLPIRIPDGKTDGVRSCITNWKSLTVVLTL